MDIYPRIVELQLQGIRPIVQALDFDGVDGFGTRRVRRVDAAG